MKEYKINFQIIHDGVISVKANCKEVAYSIAESLINKNDTYSILNYTAEESYFENTSTTYEVEQEGRTVLDYSQYKNLK